MKNSRIRVFASAVVVGALLFGLAGLAWACTPRPRLFGITITAGAPRSAVTITGEGVTPGSQVSILWNNMNGQQLGAVPADSNGDFAVDLTIPEARPGIYYLLLRAEGQDMNRLAFEVTSPAGPGSKDPARGAKVAAVSADLWRGFLKEAGSSTGGSSPNGDGLAPVDVLAQRSQTAWMLGITLTALGLTTLAAAAVIWRRRPSRSSS